MNGKNVSLRPILKTDLGKLNQWKNNEEVYQFLGGGYQPVSIDQQEKWMDSMIDLNGNSKRYIIVDGNAEAIGMIGLYDINWIHRTCEVGLYIGEQDVYGKGYASEAYYLLETFARNYLNIRKINLKVVSDNKAGISLWTKVGFVKVGEYHEERFIKGKYHDLTIMEKFI